MVDSPRGKEHCLDTSKLELCFGPTDNIWSKEKKHISGSGTWSIGGITFLSINSTSPYHFLRSSRATKAMEIVKTEPTVSFSDIDLQDPK